MDGQPKYFFKQDTGQFRRNNYPLTLLGKGYAGRDKGYNNPDMEGVKGIGPLPKGFYFPEELFEEHPTVGKYAIRLRPDDETRAKILAYGRDPDSFFMHGDSKEHPGLASHGCIVEQRPVRETVWGDKGWIQVLV